MASRCAGDRLTFRTCPFCTQASMQKKLKSASIPTRNEEPSWHHPATRLASRCAASPPMPTQLGCCGQSSLPDWSCEIATAMWLHGSDIGPGASKQAGRLSGHAFSLLSSSSKSQTPHYRPSYGPGRLKFLLNASRCRTAYEEGPILVPVPLLSGGRCFHNIVPQRPAPWEAVAV